jgi:hypothetical protein
LLLTCSSLNRRRKHVGLHGNIACCCHGHLILLLFVYVFLRRSLHVNVCSDSSVIWVSSTTWCHEWLSNFHIYRHKQFSVYHIRRGMLSSQVGLPWLFHPSDLWCVGPHPKFISGSLLRGVITRAVLSSNCYGFLGPLAFKRRLGYPRRLSSYFRKICDRLHHRTGGGSTAQGHLPDQARHDYILNFKLRSRPPRLYLGLVSFVLVWPVLITVLAAPSARCS